MLGKKKLLATAVALVGSLAVAGAATAAPPMDTERLRTAVTVDGIMEHQAALEAIANANSSRACRRARPARPVTRPRSTTSSTRWRPRASTSRCSRSRPTSSSSRRRPRSSRSRRTRRLPALRRRERRLVHRRASPVTATSTAPAVAVDFAEPTTTASTSDSGCEADGLRAATSTGKIALLQRGTCDFGLKVENAQAAGAVGAVIFNEGTIGADDRNGVLIPTLAGYDATIPVVGTDYATGRSLVDLAEPATGVTLRVKVDGFVDQDVQTNNVIAETPGGRADRTVVVGGAPRLGVRGPRHQRRRLGRRDDARDRRADGTSSASRRATRCGSSSSAARSRACSARTTTSRSCHEEADPGHLRDARLRHARVAATTRGSSTTATATSRASPARTARA